MAEQHFGSAFEANVAAVTRDYTVHPRLSKH